VQEAKVATDDWVEVGRIGGPFGVRGWVRVESYTDPAERLLDYEVWTLRSGKAAPAAHRLIEGRAQGKGLVARLENIEDRDSAQALRGATIHVARSALPPLKEREYYQVDLIGLAVRNVEGIAFGVLRQFVDTPGGPVMVVRQESGPEAGRERWIPAVPAHLSRVDLSAGVVTVDWPAELE
jgi:16S rRNA processing protein RimM